MSLYSVYSSNEQLEADGIDVQFVEGTNADKSVPTFRIAFSGGANKLYSKVLEEKTKPLRRKINNDLISNEESANIMLEVFVESVLKGWRFVKDRDGKELLFTKENAIKLFSDLPRLYDVLVAESKAFSNFKAAAREDDSKN